MQACGGGRKQDCQRGTGLLKAKAVVNPDSLIGPIKDRFGRIAEKNIKAFKRAFEETELAL